MKLARTEARGEEIGRRAAAEASERIIKHGNVPSDIEITSSEGGVAISGKRLRIRLINEPALRNFAHV